MATKPADKAKAAAPEKAEKKDKAPKEAKAKKETSAAAGDTVKSERHKEEPKKKHKKVVARSEKHCTIKSCKREYRAKGYCVAHYRKWRQGEYGVARYKTCKDHGCFKAMVRNRHGYCEEHFQSYYVKGMEVQKAVAEAPAKKDAAPAAAPDKAAAAG